MVYTNETESKSIKENNFRGPYQDAFAMDGDPFEAKR